MLFKVMLQEDWCKTKHYQIAVLKISSRGASWKHHRSYFQRKKCFVSIWVGRWHHHACSQPAEGRQWEENKQSQHRSCLIQTDMEWIPRAGSLTTWKINVSILSFTWWKSKHVKKCFPNSTPRPCKYEQVPEAERTGNWILFQMRLVHTSINLWPGLVSKETTTKQQLTLQCSRST